MRFTTTVIAVAASFAFASAQDLSKIPSCAIPCFVAALPSSGCTAQDIKCQCTTGAKAIGDFVTTCAQQKCSQSDLVNVANAAAGICAQAGITISNAASPAATPAASGAVSSALASGSAAISSAMSSASKAASPAAATATANAAAGNVFGLGAVAVGVVAGVFGL